MQKIWTKEDDKQLKKLFPNTLSAAVAETMGRTEGSVKKRAGRLGLKKTKKFLRSIGWKV